MPIKYDEIAPQERIMVTFQEAVALTTINENTLRQEVERARRGFDTKFPVCFVGKVAKIHRRLLEEWMAERCMNHDHLEPEKPKAKRGRPRKSLGQWCMEQGVSAS